MAWLKIENLIILLHVNRITASGVVQAALLVAYADVSFFSGS